MTRIAVVGAGLMGAGLSRLFRSVGWSVSVYDSNPQALAALKDVRHAASLAEMAQGATFVIEAASERLDVKHAIFAELAQVTDATTILASNSSVIPVADITADLDDDSASRTIGMHFWNPPDIIPLVEVIAGPRSDPDKIERAMAMLRAAGKEPIHVRRDTVPGNRLQHALWREAMALVDEGVCTPQDVDTIVRRSFGLRLPVLGPLETADMVGLTLTSQIHEVVLQTLSNRTGPSAGLTDRVEQGRLGALTGEGFLTGWTPEKLAETRRRVSEHLAVILAPRSTSPRRD